jgi:predicted phage terminase large subunit-like protein
MQRLHEDDLSGHLLTKEPSEWTHIKIPAIVEGKSIWEDKYPLETLLKMQKAKPRMFAGQMMQEPAPLEGNIFKEAWLNWYDGLNRFTEIYQSWDCAIKEGQDNDYTVCTTWGVSSNQLYLLDYFSDKMDFPTAKRAILAQAEKWKPRQVIIEDKASGQGLLQVLKKETRLPIIAYEPKGDKVSRFAKATLQMESGRVYFPKGKPWLDEVVLQLKTFPNAKHDDIVDSVSQFINWYLSKSEIDVFVF